MGGGGTGRSCPCPEESPCNARLGHILSRRIWTRWGTPVENIDTYSIQTHYEFIYLTVGYYKKELFYHFKTQFIQTFLLILSLRQGYIQLIKSDSKDEGDHVTLDGDAGFSFSLRSLCPYFKILSVKFEPLCIRPIMSTKAEKGDLKREIEQSP